MPRETNEDKNEQIRAIFVLGLLAVLASIRVQNSSINATIGKMSVDILPIIDVMILLMSFYSLFMIFGYSKDMMGKSAADAFKEMAKSFLILNFIVLLVVAVLFAIGYYQNRFLWFLAIMAIPVAYVTYRKLKTLKIKKISLKSKEQQLSLLSIAVFLALIISLLEIGYYSSEEFVPIFFVIGAVCMTAFLYLSKKQKSEQKKLD